MKKRTIFILILILGFTDMVFAGTIVGKVSTRKVKVPKDFLIYIEKVEGKEFPAPQEIAKMDQISLVFVPRVLPILKGAKVEFHNSDDVKHNVFGVGTEDFDLGTWTKGGAKSYAFDKLGETAILCNLHPEMEAYIVVLQNPYFALSDEEGNYKIKDVPSGTYNLKTWHERLKSVTKEIQVADEGEVVENFELKQ